jgi:hypothetical protein
VFSKRGLEDPAMQQARKAVDLVLKGHEPYPAIAVDRHWTLVAHNAAVPALLTTADPALLQPPVNVLRLSLHPDGMAPRIANLAEWRAHLLARLHRQAAATGDARLAELHQELRGYPGGESGSPSTTDVVVPLRYRHGDQELSFFSITAVVGTPMDVTVQELAIESFYPADEATTAALQALPA